MDARRRWRWVAGIAGAGFGLVAAALLGQSPLATLACAGFASIAAVASTVDLQERRIPNRLTYPGSVAAVALASPLGMAAVGQALWGALFAGGVMGVLWFFGRGRLGLGLGDVKLSAMVGTFLGAAYVPMYLVVGSGLGAIAGLVMLASGRDRQETFAFGPFLSIGALGVMLFAGPVVA